MFYDSRYKVLDICFFAVQSSGDSVKDYDERELNKTE